MDKIIPQLFLFIIMIATLISFYFFVDVLILKNKDHSHIFNTWQFPMLFAITLDAINGWDIISR